MGQSDAVILGTRGSKLALIQSNWVADRLSKMNPGLDVRIKIINTAGDRVTSAPFAQVGAQGIFVKEIEAALTDGQVDLAVHSLKDMHTDLRPDVTIGSIPARESACDVVLSREGLKLEELADGAIIGTSSARRRGMLAAEGRGFDIQECRGNLQTRIEKLKRGDYDAILLAEAGLSRMGIMDEITEVLPIGRFIPAVGQGALCIEIRSDDDRIQQLVKPLSDDLTYNACIEERNFLREIGGGCHAPVGGHVYYAGDEAVFLAYVGTSDASWHTRDELRVSIAKISGLGLRMAERIKRVPGVDAFYEEVAHDAQ